MAQIIVNIIFTWAVYIPIALSLWLLLWTRKIFNFIFPVLFVSSPYFASSICSFTPIAYIPAFIISIALTTLISVALEIIIVSKVCEIGSGSLRYLVAFIGILIFGINLIALTYGAHSITLLDADSVVNIEMVGNVMLTNWQLVIIAFAIICCICMLLWKRYSRMGKLMEAVASDPEMALIVGINVSRVYLYAMSLASALAGTAGILVGCDVDITPSMGIHYFMMGLVAVVIGGNSLWGSVLGALLLGVSLNISALWLPTQWMDSIALLILLLLLLFFPQGFFGKKSQRASL